MQKNHLPKKSFKIFALFFLGIISSCQENNPYKETDNGLGVGNRDTIAKKKIQNPPQALKLYDKTGRVAIQIEISKREALIRYDANKRYVVGRFEEGKNPIYFDEKGDIIAKISTIDKGLIIKNNGNQDILWVKEKDKVFLIADNPRLKNAFEIRKEKNLTRLYSPSKMIAEMRLEENKVILKGYDVYEIKDFKEKIPNPAYIVSLLNEIPEQLRYIVLVEMIR